MPIRLMLSMTRRPLQPSVGWCAICADWIREAGYEGDKEAAREVIHGMPSAEWKATRQTPATEEQLARMEASIAKNAQE